MAFNINKTSGVGPATVNIQPSEYNNTGKEVYLILDKLFDKRIYEVKDTKYVNLNGLKGKYTIYYRIDGKVYKTDYYIEV